MYTLVKLGVFPLLFRWCECLVGAIVEVTYVVTMAAMRRLCQLVWPVGSPLGTEASPSFELVVYGPMGEVSHQSLMDSFEGVESTEALYEEVEDVYTEVGEVIEDGWSGYLETMASGSEDEGVFMEGDAGFIWEDTRWELWRWEEENGVGEDESEEDDEQQDHEEEDKDKEEEEEIWE